jgi:NB-ARC domain
MSDQEAIQSQLKILAAHRRTLAHYLRQEALAGPAHVKPEIGHGISEARDHIRRIKANLRRWGIAIEDLPDDEIAPVVGASPFTVPFMDNMDFVGRQEVLQQLHSLLLDTKPIGIRPVGLTGMFGIGKTQTAVKYAYCYRDTYSGGIFWINAAEPLIQEFTQVGCYLRPELINHTVDEQVRAVGDYLFTHPDTLVILDNLSDPAILNRPVSVGLIPAALPCRILCTTRRRDQRYFRAIEVTVLSEDAALKLLLHHPSRQSILEPGDPQHTVARAVSRMLGRLPLALEIAAAFLGEWPEVTLAGFRARLENEGCLDTLDEESDDLFSRSLFTIHQTALTASLRTQWTALTNDTARKLLCIAGLLAEAAIIPITRLGLLAGVPSKELPGRPSPLTRALKLLESACLVEILQGEQVQLHPLVREFSVGQIPDAERVAFRCQCVANMAKTYENNSTLEGHCATRGVKAVHEDLIVAMELLSALSSKDNAEIQKEYERINRILSLLQHG